MKIWAAPRDQLPATKGSCAVFGAGLALGFYASVEVQRMQRTIYELSLRNEGLQGEKERQGYELARHMQREAAQQMVSWSTWCQCPPPVPPEASWPGVTSSAPQPAQPPPNATCSDSAETTGSSFWGSSTQRRLWRTGWRS